MKNTHIIIIILVLILGGLFLFGRGSKLEAPTGGSVENVTDSTSLAGSENIPMDTPGIVEIPIVKEFSVSGKNFSFTPSTIKVKKGDRVKITFKNSAGFHNFVIGEFGVTTKQAQAPYEEVLEFTADKAGSFEYYCSVGSHRATGMKGTLVIEE
ncbi:hypothetical protein A3A95_03040 [Candidatus Nomurabacteria bacterium RIFCSPLOWO2_01_FULL_39_18]|uniref:EfeO-type cupredoxin-like domain-containing protein n=1 Tax=Candidatus Nomurabacteria bacterium RIFCSPHIGHO2_01_FULL_40_24b TaxID=1801739 RepID=A0A1F6V744_9BACT|nr:MAG: hypothetical protein A2647_03525 [Candidatus Nomurabacteria bacterium RIFCSPHIGHO2_01_FULL_40_24b]OGI89633.1 MAG: hypothetical protein A3A95_03040 [Candidatus Nomurabacteria bacterium RIFCSPLOWO2_01_FULL_39_18]